MEYWDIEEKIDNALNLVAELEAQLKEYELGSPEYADIFQELTYAYDDLYYWENYDATA